MVGPRARALADVNMEMEPYDFVFEAYDADAGVGEPRFGKNAAGAQAYLKLLRSKQGATCGRKRPLEEYARDHVDARPVAAVVSIQVPPTPTPTEPLSVVPPSPSTTTVLEVVPATLQMTLDRLEGRLDSQSKQIQDLADLNARQQEQQYEREQRLTDRMGEQLGKQMKPFLELLLARVAPQATSTAAPASCC